MRSDLQIKAILISVRPPFASMIIEGRKTVELRRVRPHVREGQKLLIYCTSPTMALLASAVVAGVEEATPGEMWGRVKEAAGVRREQYREYFRNASAAVAIWLRDVSRLERPVTLAELRKRMPGFNPPQSYRFVRERDEGWREYLL